MNLFKIEEQYQHIMQLLEASEGEVTPEIAEQLELNSEDFESKAQSYMAMIRKWRSELAATKVEQERLAKFKKNRENAIERLSNNLDYAMKNRNLKTLDRGVNGKISYRKSTAVIVDESLLGEEWFTEVIKKSPQKAELKKALAEGQEIPGAVLEERQNIQIK